MPEDPKEKLTKWLTEGLAPADDRLHLDRTRMMFRGQKEWYHAALALEDDYFTQRVERDQQMMMAFKGKRSDDVVESLRSVHEDGKIMSGVQPVTEELRKRNKYKTSE